MRPLQARCYRILDVTVRLRSDSPHFLALFDRDYGFFRLACDGAKPSLVADVRVAGPRGPEVLCARRGRSGAHQAPGTPPAPCRQSLAGHPNPIWHAYRTVVRAVLEEVRGFLLLHAGVVARGAEAVLLAGPSGVGKTTLVRALLEEGLAFLSDDYGPVNRTTGEVHPFPRSLWARPDAHARPAGAGAHREAGPAAFPLPPNGKRPIRPARTRARVETRPLRPVCLFCLHDADPHPTSRRIVIGLKAGGPSPLLAELRSLHPEIRARRRRRDVPEWHVTVPPGLGLNRHIRALLARHREETWSVFAEQAVSPTFSRRPSVEPIPLTEAVTRLAGDLKTGDDAPHRCSEGARRRPGRLFLELCSLLEGTACFLLNVGELDRMCAQVLATLDADPNPEPRSTSLDAPAGKGQNGT